MQATETLKHEHRVIELVLNALERMANAAEAGQPVEREKAERALEIVREFADKCHHGKEEERLFKVMQERGVPREGGPIGVMLQEHDAGRSHVRGMAEALPAAARGEAGALRVFAEHARGYVGLLRQHIFKEDNILYPMAEQVLSADDDAQLARSFEKFEEEEIGAGTHEKYHTWAHQLAEEQ